MRVTKILVSAIAVGVAMVGFSTKSDAADVKAEDVTVVSCSGGNVTATAKAPWHTNDKAPWKWDKGDKVSLSDHEAKFKGAKCEGTLKVYVCNGDQCLQGSMPVK